MLEALEKAKEIYPKLSHFFDYVDENPYLCVEICERDFPPRILGQALLGDIRPYEAPFVFIYKVRNRYNYAVMVFGLNPEEKVICYRRRNEDPGASGSFRGNGTGLTLDLLMDNPNKLIDVYDLAFSQLCSLGGPKAIEKVGRSSLGLSEVSG
jgi:hypothetical protein